MNIYNVLCRQIEDFFEELKTHDLFYRRVFSGSLTVDELALFIKNVSILTANTPKHLRLAKKMARQRGCIDLAKFFAKKLGEEVGHDSWGDEDLAGLRERYSINEQVLSTTKPMQELIRAQENFIKDDPYYYFVYVLFAEYFTVVAGSSCLSAIEMNNKIPRELMSIIGKHAELDVHHVHEWGVDAEVVGLQASELSVYQEQMKGIMERYRAFTQTLSVQYVNHS